MQRQSSETWDIYVGSQTPQQFMNSSRESNPDITIEQAVAEYVQQIPFMSGKWHEVQDEETGEMELVSWSQDELDDIGRGLVSYLERTQGEAWDIPEGEEPQGTYLSDVRNLRWVTE